MLLVSWSYIFIPVIIMVSQYNASAAPSSDFKHTHTHTHTSCALMAFSFTPLSFKLNYSCIRGVNQFGHTDKKGRRQIIFKNMAKAMHALFLYCNHKLVSPPRLRRQHVDGNNHLNLCGSGEKRKKKKPYLMSKSHRLTQ